MEAHKEWLIANGYDGWSQQNKDNSAKTWRAALEWAKTQEDYTRYDCIPLTLINKELGVTDGGV